MALVCDHHLHIGNYHQSLLLEYYYYCNCYNIVRNNSSYHDNVIVPTYITFLEPIVTAILTITIVILSLQSVLAISLSLWLLLCLVPVWSLLSLITIYIYVNVYLSPSPSCVCVSLWSLFCVVSSIIPFWCLLLVYLSLYYHMWSIMFSNTSLPFLHCSSYCVPIHQEHPWNIMTYDWNLLILTAVLRIQQEHLQRRQGQGAPDEGGAGAGHGHGAPRGSTAADHLLGLWLRGRTVKW